MLIDGRLSRSSNISIEDEMEYQLVEMFGEERMSTVDFVERDLDFDIFLRQRNILIHLPLVSTPQGLVPPVYHRNPAPRTIDSEKHSIALYSDR